MRIIKLRFSLRMLFGIVAITACCFYAAFAFEEQNRSDWEREQLRMIKDNAVRRNVQWNIGKLKIGLRPTLPEWIIAWLPVENPDIFYRVTTLDISSGTAYAENLLRWTEFQHVDTIRLSEFHDTNRLLAAFTLFPRLQYIELTRRDTDSRGKSMIEEAEKILPNVKILYRQSR